MLKGKIEKDLRTKGLVCAGVDEVGKGCLAGPVFAGCVVLDFPKLLSHPNTQLKLLRDSKTLSSQQRSRLLPFIAEVSIAHSVAESSVEEIETLGLQKATYLAMQRAIDSLKLCFDILLIDGRHTLPNYPHPQMAIIKGDALCYSIAAASIIAKEARDEIMRKEAKKHPFYGFENHVGYATSQHQKALMKLGACALHRKNFAPVRKALETPYVDR